MSLIANARMYAVDPATAAAWSALFAHVAQRSGVGLDIVAHAAPAPLEELWRRGDLGLAFICGYPFASGEFPVRAVAAPVPLSSHGAPLYATHLVARAESGITTLAESFGRRLGWTAAHSQSGFNALRSHLLPHRRDDRPLYAQSRGPLLTPRRVIEAVLANEIDIGPLDSFFHDLLSAAEPETASRLRIVETTASRPMPLFVASHATSAHDVAALKAALIDLGGDQVGRLLLSRLRLSGFAEVEPEDYGVLMREVQAADRAGYPVPG